MRDWVLRFVVGGCYIVALGLLAWLLWQKYAIYPDLTEQRLFFMFWPHEVSMVGCAVVGRVLHAVWL